MPCPRPAETYRILLRCPVGGARFDQLRAGISRQRAGRSQQQAAPASRLAGSEQHAGIGRSNAGAHLGQQRRERLFPDRGSWLASLLWRLAPALYHRKMSQRFAGEMS